MDIRKRLSSGGESFSEGTSRFFSSMIAKKNGLMNDLSQKIESVMKSSSSESSLSDSEGEVTDNVSNVKNLNKNEKIPSSVHQTSEVNHVQTIQTDNQVLSVSDEPLRELHNSGNSKAGMLSRKQRSMCASGVCDSKNNPVVNMSFDDLLYTPSKKSPPENINSNVAPRWKATQTPPPIPPPPNNPNKESRRSSKTSTDFQKTSSNHSSDSEKNVADEKNTEEKNKAPDKQIIVQVEKSRAPTLASIKRRSSTVDEMLFDDYVEPNPEMAPDKKPVEDNVFNKRKTLHPMTDLISFDEPELEDFHPKQVINVRNSKSSEQSLDKSLPCSVSSIDSSEPAVFDEQAVNNQTSIESSEPEFDRENHSRLDSAGSYTSSYSLESQPDDLTLECMGFMKLFVEKIFNPSVEISQLDKAKFGEYCQQVPGRQWFARYINAQRGFSRKVDESTIFRLVQYLAVALFECNEAEDYVPAKTLMNMCFTFYHESRHDHCKTFLYSYLCEQPIWQSLRFWHAAFFDAVQTERARKPVCTSEDDPDFQTDDSMFQENITFGQLGTFTNNMRAFGLSRELCLEFLRKQSTIADLKPDQIKMIKDNIERWKDV